MIKSFKCAKTEAFYLSRLSSKIPPNLHKIAFKKLILIDQSKTLKNLSIPPANRLEALKGNRKGQHSIRINQQYRICFIWEGEHAYNVEIVDYH